MTNRGFIGLVSAVGLIAGLILLLFPFEAGPARPQGGELVRCGTAFITDEHAADADSDLEFFYGKKAHFVDDCAASRTWRLAAGIPLAIIGLVGGAWFVLVKPKGAAGKSDASDDTAAAQQ